MENRFGIKDFFLFLVIFVLIGVVTLAMIQFDRQYDDVQTIKTKQNDLIAELQGLKQQLNNGIAVAPSTAASPTTTTAAGTPANTTLDMFTPLRQAEKLPGFARGDWLIDDFTTKIGKLTPLTSSDVYQQWIELIVCDSLAIRDLNTLDFVPRLATRWDVSEDTLTMRFYMRRGVTFSDGTPLTADDVLYTFEQIRNPDIQADRTRSGLTKLKDVKKIDDNTVEFTFTEPYYLNFEAVAQQSILSKKFYGRFKASDYNEQVGLLMGSGPYMLENPETWAPGAGVTLYRNPRFWGTQPTFDRLVFRETEGEGTLMVKYGNKEDDILRCTPSMYDKVIKDARVVAFSQKLAYTSVYGGYTYIGWNEKRVEGGSSKDTLFADKRVRQAMTMLVDRERLVKEIYLGYANVASGPFAPQGPQSAPDVKPLPFDVDKAKALLAEVGFADRDGDHVLESSDGKPFRFTLVYPSGNESTERIVLFLKDAFARADIVMVPERVDWPVLINKLNASDFEAVTLGWSSSPESDLYQVFHSDMIKGQGDNRVSYSNPELDKIISVARVTRDYDARMKLWNQAHRILAEDQPFTFLVNRLALRVINNRVQNIETSKAGLNYEHLNGGGMLPWYVPRERQAHTQ